MVLKSPYCYVKNWIWVLRVISKIKDQHDKAKFKKRGSAAIHPF
jgi:hypothetical protein